MKRNIFVFGILALALVGCDKGYKIGDKGPAGGIVFYDKGVSADGWRYLEAAPAETEFSTARGVYEQAISGTGRTVGTGKQNTQLIVDFLNNNGESGSAAQQCVSLDFNKYKDWFLPSIDELNLMYTNLKAKGLGGFSEGWYWSSSAYNDIGISWYESFNDGAKTDPDSFYFTDRTFSVRAVRAF
jgi:hypothetical protein